MSCCQSRLLRAKRETSRAQTAPTLPRQTSATIRSNPARCTLPAAERPRSSSMTSISDQPSTVRRSRMAPEQRVSQIGACFIKRAHPVELSHWRVSEAAQLRKDEPHPMALLPAGLQFIQGSSEDGGLRDHEAVQVEGISVRHLRPPPGDLRWRLRPTRLSIGIGSSCGRSLNTPNRFLVGSTWAMAVWRLSGQAKKPIWPQLMCGTGAAFHLAALLQEDLSEPRERIRHEVWSLVCRREQDEVGEALNQH